MTSTTHRISRTSGKKNSPSPLPLAVSAYDRVASLLIALLLLIGFFVVLMFLIWLTRVLTFHQEAVPVTLVEEYAGRGEHAQGYERDLEEPGLEELEELAEPQLEQALEAVTDVVTSQAAALDELQTDALVTGYGKGVGDSRMAGPGGEGDDIIPRWERWEIKFASNSLDAYARELDHFNIELGAVGGGSPQVDYVANLTRGSPTVRQGAGDDEKRLYMTWSSGQLQQFDRQLLQRAGVNAQGRIIMQFYPPDLENRLATLELEYARQRNVDSVKKIRRTVFAVQRQGPDFQFAVVEQTYRTI